MRVVCLNQDKGISPSRKKGAAVHLDAMRTALRALGAEVVAIDEHDAERARVALEAALSNGGIDLVYERYALRASTGSAFAKVHGIPHVLEVNAPLADEARRYREGDDADADAESRVLSGADRVFAVSAQVAEFAIANGADPARVEVHPNGVDTERFQPRGANDELRARLVPGERFAIGFHGRLRPWHGIGLLVDALEELVRRGVDLHFVFVGVGADEVRERLTGRLPDDRATLVEWVPHEEVGRYVATFDALPLTYSTDAPCYFSPLKLAESMACGVVPVFPPLGDLERVLRDGVNAVAYEPDRPGALADALAALAADAARRERLAAAALADAREMSWERIARAVLARAEECVR